jgi:hypothetical protein
MAALAWESPPVAALSAAASATPELMRLAKSPLNDASSFLISSLLSSEPAYHASLIILSERPIA